MTVGSNDLSYLFFLCCRRAEEALGWTHFTVWSLCCVDGTKLDKHFYSALGSLEQSLAQSLAQSLPLWHTTGVHLVSVHECFEQYFSVSHVWQKRYTVARISSGKLPFMHNALKSNIILYISSFLLHSTVTLRLFVFEGLPYTHRWWSRAAVMPSCCLSYAFCIDSVLIWNIELSVHCLIWMHLPPLHLSLEILHTRAKPIFCSYGGVTKGLNWEGYVL